MEVSLGKVCKTSTIVPESKNFNEDSVIRLNKKENLIEISSDNITPISF